MVYHSQQQTLDAFHDEMLEFFEANGIVQVNRKPVEYVFGYLCITNAMIAVFSNSNIQITWNERTFLIRNSKLGEIVDGQWNMNPGDDYVKEFKTLLKWLAESEIG